ncbi:Ribosome-releasing factor 2, mitochondrial [Conoideocrella luteorostrata]|uniref:Ribosome-releasing factor 2, mitochondrial n=1 Tax=Conoideocrella luteorostrata TaxID=1105319 RepID=A0AAJ0FUT6_9HYPO|nr:Ribosome-releasing factor 2, mitochondrial [Conoideocrella luteorostrata]
MIIISIYRRINPAPSSLSRSLRHVSASKLAPYSRESLHSKAVEQKIAEAGNIRNIGIIAHVDAGKTTTTERMLYYSGVTQRVGDVDAGNTVTDFLELERERGITIQSAAITFNWPSPPNCAPGTHPKTVNLIDTPGHQDFRFEVDRCLPILDGAVCIIDSVKGVEAHTERVWSSAQDFKIPRIVYCNKLDREGASFKKAVLEVGTRLKGWPLVCQIPWWEKDQFVGVIDIIEGVAYRWKSEREKIRYGPEELKKKLAESNPELLAEVEIARQRLVEGLADFDEAIMDEFLADNPEIPNSAIKQAIRRTILGGDGRVIPVFAGSSFRHIGVEPLMDAITDYLPSPAERPDAEVRIGSSKLPLQAALDAKGKKGGSNVASVASVFKVFNHPKEGVISFVRVYHGTLTRNASSFNTNVHAQERPMGILQISASKTQDVQELSVGQIGALRGLKKARSGDTLITTTNGKPVAEYLRHAQIRPPEIPPPVAFLQVEPYGNVAAQDLQVALENASREDPSLRWSRNSRTDQFTIQGMGKLHLDVSLYNMRQKHKIDAEFGQIEVDYKESVTQPTKPQYTVFDRPVASKPGKAACTVALEPIDADNCDSLSGSGTEIDGNIYEIVIPESARLSDAAFDIEEARHQLLNGAIAGLARGPRRASPIHSCRVKITLDTSEEGFETPSGGHFSGVARTAVQNSLRDAFDRQQIGVLEPIMLTHITCPEVTAGIVQHDITAGAGGQVLEVKDRSAESSSDELIDASRIYAPPDPYDSVTSLRGKKSTDRMVEIVAKVPYKEMLDYDDHLRSKTAGRHSMTMSFDSFARVVGHREKGL